MNTRLLKSGVVVRTKFKADLIAQTRKFIYFSRSTRTHAATIMAKLKIPNVEAWQRRDWRRQFQPSLKYVKEVEVKFSEWSKGMSTIRYAHRACNIILCIFSAVLAVRMTLTMKILINNNNRKIFLIYYK
jgi:hypothetical protein